MGPGGPPTQHPENHSPGAKFWVRRNLWTFLKRASKDPELNTRLFWIDAICIDQNGTAGAGFKEKNHQVGLLKDIYSNAEEVITWLSEPDQEQKKDMKVVQAYLTHEDSLPKDRKQIAGNEAPVESRHIFTHAYWTRIWVIQEFLLAKHILVRFGRFSFPWTDIQPFITHFAGRHGPKVKAVNIVGRPAMAIIDWRDGQFKQEKPVTLTHIVQRFQHHECTNPLDQVYGLLGLVDKEERIIAPDYDKSAVQVYEQLMRCYALSGKISPLEGQSDCCEYERCQFPRIMKKIPDVDFEGVDKVYGRLTREEGVKWQSLHPFTERCRFNEACEIDWREGRAWL